MIFTVINCECLKNTNFNSRNEDKKQTQKKRDEQMHPYRQQKQIFLFVLQNFQIFVFTGDHILHAENFCQQEIKATLISFDAYT